MHRLVVVAWKILGALAVVAPGLPRLKEWAYAGFFFELTAAAASRAFVGDALGDILAPIVFLGVVAASWALRPASRRLAVPAHVRTDSRITDGAVALGTR